MRIRLQVLKAKFIQHIPILGCALLFSLSLPFLDYFRQDTTIAYPPELWPLVGLHVAICLIFYTLYAATLRTSAARLIATIVAVYVLMQHFPRLIIIFARLLPGIPGDVQALIITIFALAGIWGAGRLIQIAAAKWNVKNRDIVTFGAFICLTIFVLNSYSLAEYFWSHHQATSYSPADTAKNVKLTTTSDRDIYYIVMDRYASKDSLSNYFDINNSAFLEQLQGEGFTTRDDAHSNYQFTAPSIASTVRMDYHADLASDLAATTTLDSMPYENIIRKSPVSELLKNSGYDIYNVGNWWGPTREGNDSTNILPIFELTLFDHHFALSELQSNAIERTFLQGIFNSGWKVGSHELIGIAFDAHRDTYIDQMKNLNTLAAAPHDKPRFVFAHMLMPHPPYVFTQSGGIPTYNSDDDDTDIPRSQKYANQLQYGNQTLNQLILNIQQHSKTPPIIVIQADEGPYPLVAPVTWESASAATLNLKLGTLAAYSLPGTTTDEQASVNSNVNISRFIFNKYFGATLPYLPDCSFVYDANKPFVFYDITSKLHAESDSCKTIK